MENFKDRLDHILRSKNLTAKKFAELMEIQPSNVSHLLSGRNKPSVDFLTKLKEIFPEYSFDWIIMGRKPITINDPTPTAFDNHEVEFEPKNDDKIIEFDDIEEKIEEKQPIMTDEKEVEKILVIYTDKTFDVLLPN